MVPIVVEVHKMATDHWFKRAELVWEWLQSSSDHFGLSFRKQSSLNTFRKHDNN